MKGHIRQRSKGKWEITIDAGRDLVTEKRLRHFETVTGTKREAQHRMAELQLEIGNSTYVKPKRLTVVAWLEQWLDGHVKGNLAPKTTESYRQQLRDYVIPRLGHLKLGELRPQHIQDYMAWALAEGRRLGAGGLSRRTVQYHYFILSKALADAVKMDLLAVNPCKAVGPPKVIRRTIPALGDGELSRLLASISESSYPLFYEALLYTGLRRGEMLALRWRDIDLDMACVYVTRSLQKLDDGTVVFKEPKTDTSRRRVALSPSLALRLRAHRNEQAMDRAIVGGLLEEDDLVFCHPDGRPLNPSSVTHTFRKAAARAGLPQLRLHDLRHIHATLMLKDGVHPKIVSERLGHASVGITLDTYSHVLPGLQEAGAERFDRLIPSMEAGESLASQQG